MRVALYLRVSTSNQVHDQTIDQQLERLSAYAQTKSWILTDNAIFRDDGWSGARLRRPGLDRLRDTIQGRAFDRILVTAPDRLARNYVHQMLLIEEFEHAGCCVEFIERPMSQDPHDQLLLQIRGAVAEYERTLIAERMRRGRLAKLQAGVMLPWTHPPYAYRLHPDRPRDPTGVTLDPAEAAVVKELFAWYLEPAGSLYELVRRLRAAQIPSPHGQAIWGVATIRGILTNPAYVGQVYSNRVSYRPPQVRRSATHPIGRPHNTAVARPRDEWLLVATVPAVVSQSEFDQVGAKLAMNQSFASRNNSVHPYLLRALVSCGLCSMSCTARTLNHRNNYYVCAGRAKAIQSKREEPCPSRYIPAHELDALVWQDLCEVVMEPARIGEALARAQEGAWMSQDLQARRETLRKGQQSLAQQLDRLTEAYLQNVIPLAEYERRRRELEQKQEALAAQAQQLGAQQERQVELAGVATTIEGFCERVREGLSTATFDQKRKLVELLIDRVIVTGDEVEIRYVVPTSAKSENVRFCQLRSDYFNAPNVIGVLTGCMAQQVRIHLMVGMTPTEIGTGMNGSNAHLLHVLLNRCPTGFHLLLLQQGCDTTRAVKRILCVDGINAMLDVDFSRRWRDGLIIQA